MENMEVMNDVVTEVVPDTVEDVVEDVCVSNGSGLKTAAKYLSVGALTIVGWEYIVKPCGRKLIGWVRKKHTEHKIEKAKKVGQEEIDLDNMKIEDLPNID